MERRLRETNGAVSRQIADLRREVSREFGPAASLIGSLFGPLLWWTSLREDRALAAGKVYEPPMFLERTNWEPV
jgi:hypothetical protein